MAKFPMNARLNPVARLSRNKHHDDFSKGRKPSRAHHDDGARGIGSSYELPSQG